MLQSQQVLEWQMDARVDHANRTLLRLLALRFPPGAPEDLLETIRSTTDLARLDRWIDAAATIGSLDEFRQAMQL
jgi:hypothetical protein